MRIMGLPVSLWDRAILRRIREECGGFLAVDSQTEKLEELQWARILVKMNGEELPNVVEIWSEDFCYVSILWWEVRSVLRAGPTGKRGMKAITGGEVGGESYAQVSSCWRRSVSQGLRPCRCLLMGRGGRHAGRGSLWSNAWVSLL